MAEMTIRLRCDPATGKKDIIVSLRSDEDALPHEHEQQHKALVEKLIDGGLLKASEVGQIGEVLEQERTAVLVQPDDARELAEAVVRLTRDATLRAQLGHAARLAAEQQHTWTANAQRVVDTLATVGGN